MPFFSLELPRSRSARACRHEELHGVRCLSLHSPLSLLLPLLPSPSSDGRKSYFSSPARESRITASWQMPRQVRFFAFVARGGSWELPQARLLRHRGSYCRVARAAWDFCENPCAWMKVGAAHQISIVLASMASICLSIRQSWRLGPNGLQSTSYSGRGRVQMPTWAR